MNKINLIVIGCGRIGRMHVDIINKFFNFVNIEAIIDSNIDLNWLKQYNIKFYNREQLPQLLRDKNIHAVLIATSSNAQVSIIKQAASAGKHIFCEKPVGFTIQDIQEAINAVENAGVKFQVGYNRRFDPEFNKVRQVINDGKVGMPHIIKITNRDPKRPDLNFIPRSGGLFMDFNVHDFDMARFITGSEVAEVFAMGNALIDPKIADLNDIDTAIITLKMQNGSLCVIDSSRETNYGYDQRLEILGSEGSIAAQNINETQTFLTTDAGVVSEKPYHSFEKRYARAYQLQLAAFFNYINSHNESPVNGYDAQTAVAIANAANQSLLEGRSITLS